MELKEFISRSSLYDQKGVQGGEEVVVFDGET